MRQSDFLRLFVSQNKDFFQFRSNSGQVVAPLQPPDENSNFFGTKQKKKFQNPKFVELFLVEISGIEPLTS